MFPCDVANQTIKPSSDRDDHRGESEEQDIAGVYLWTSGDGHSSSRLIVADCLAAVKVSQHWDPPSIA